MPSGLTMQICSEDWYLKIWQVKTICPPGLPAAEALGTEALGTEVAGNSVSMTGGNVSGPEGVADGAEGEPVATSALNVPTTSGVGVRRAAIMRARPGTSRMKSNKRPQANNSTAVNRRRFELVMHSL